MNRLYFFFCSTRCGQGTCSLLQQSETSETARKHRNATALIVQVWKCPIQNKKLEEPTNAKNRHCVAVIWPLWRTRIETANTTSYYVPTVCLRAIVQLYTDCQAPRFLHTLTQRLNEPATSTEPSGKETTLPNDQMAADMQTWGPLTKLSVQTGQTSRTPSSCQPQPTAKDSTREYLLATKEHQQLQSKMHKFARRDKVKKSLWFNYRIFLNLFCLDCMNRLYIETKMAKNAGRRNH